MDAILVTGGAGFIGSHTVRRLCTEPGLEKIIIVDNFYSSSDEKLQSIRCQNKLIIVEADVSQLNVLWEKLSYLLIPGATGIIHLAAVVGVTEVRDNPVQGYISNVEGTFNMLELARRIDAAKFVYASSAAVYGEPKYVPIDENHPQDPVNLYGATKLAGEALVNGYARDYGLSTVVLRYFNVYGPGMKIGPYAGVVYKFIDALLRKQQPTIYGDGRQTRDFVYIEDVVEANIKALRSRVNGVYNIGSGKETSILELYYTICNIVGYCPRPKHRPPRPGDIKRSVANIDRARKELEWDPLTPLREGLVKTVRYYMQRI